MKLFIGIVCLFGIAYFILRSKKNPYEEDYIVSKSIDRQDKLAIKDARNLERLQDRMNYHEMNGRHSTTDHYKAEVIGHRMNDYNNPLSSMSAPKSANLGSTTLKR